MSADALLVTFNFEIRLTVENAGALGLVDPLCGGAFAECDGLEMSMEPVVVREGGNNASTPVLVGPVSYGTLTLRRGMTTGLDLWRWFAGATAGRHRGARANGVILQRDAAGTTVLRYRLKDCLPVKLKAPALSGKDGAIAIEELQVAYASFSVEAA